MADYLRPCEAKSTALRKSITAYRRAVHPPVSRMKREALEEYTKEFPVRDYVPDEELEAWVTPRQAANPDWMPYFLLQVRKKKKLSFPWLSCQRSA